MPTPNTTPSRSAVLASLMPMITVGLVLLYAAGAYFLLFKSKAAQLLPGGALDVAILETKASDDRAYLKKLQEGKSAFEKLNAERRARVGGIATAGPDIPGLMVQTDAVAARNGFVLTSIDAVADEKNVSAAGRKSVRVSANFQGGDYQQFKVLLADLENALRVSDPQSIVFSSGASNFGLTFDVYYVDPPGTPVAPVKK